MYDFKQKIKSILEVNNKPKVVVLTGAGISAESGIQTFRDSNGLWENHKIEEVATPEGFYKNPQLVYKFYNDRRAQALSCEPSNGHFALKKLEDILSDNFYLITQNVDNLHEKAGSKNLVHMHGELFKVRCLKCAEVFQWQSDCDLTHLCEKCGGGLRPHIVWFHEMPFFMDEIYERISKCDIFVSIGTSGVVYPAAGFFQTAAQNGAYTVEINLKSTGGSFDSVIEGPAGIAVNEFVSLFNCLE